MKIERMRQNRSLSWVSIVGLMVMPLLIVAGLALTTWNSGNRISNISAAIVNNDQPVTINGQSVSMGRELSSAIVNQDDDIKWSTATQEEATKGLADGTYAVAVVIPQNFSSAATSFSGNDAEAAQQATIDVKTSEASSIADAQIARDVASLAVNKLNSTLTGTYLDNIYVGFNTTGEQFVTIATAAGQLAESTKKIDEDLDKASEDITKLDEDVTKITAKNQETTDRGTRLTTGTGELATNAGNLNTGMQDLNGKLTPLLDGVNRLAPDAANLANNASTVNTGVKNYTDNGAAVGTALRDQANAAGELAKNLNTLNTNTAALQKAANLPTAPDTQEIASGSNTVSTSAAEVSNAVDTYRKALEATTWNAEGQEACLAQGLTDEQCRAVLAIGFKAGIAAATAKLDQSGLGSSENGAPGKAAKVATDAADLKQKVDSFSPRAQAFSAAAGELAKNAQGLGEIPGLADSAGKISTGLGSHAGQAEDLVNNAGGLATSANDLATGAAQFNDGVTQTSQQLPSLGEGVTKLATDTKTLSDGTTTLNQDTRTYVDGVNTYTTDTKTANDKLTELKTKKTKDLTDASEKLQTSTSTFAEQIASGAELVPSFDESARDKLSTVVTAPVSNSVGGVSSPITQTVILLLGLGLWFGALATFLIVRPVPSKELATSQPLSKVAWASMWPGFAVGAVQAVVLGVFGGVVLGLGLGGLTKLTMVLLLISTAFIAVNQALAGWLKGTGRFIVVALGVLATATGMVSTVPTFFTAVEHFSPLRPALRSIRSLVTGASLVSPLLLLLAWAVVGVGGSLLAVWRKRNLSLAADEAEDESDGIDESQADRQDWLE